MKDLPISISSVPAKTTASKPSGNDDASAADSQGFGNVLARQVADAGKPAETNSRPSADQSGQTAEQVSTETTPAADGLGSQPADMMATLLAQQNPGVVPQLDGGIHPDNNNQLYGNSMSGMITPVLAGAPVTAEKQVSYNQVQGNPVPGNQLPEKQMMTPLAIINGKASPANTPIEELDAARAPLKSTGEDGKLFAATLKTKDKNELTAPASSNALRGSVIGELSANTPQSGSLPTLPTSTLISSQTTINTPLSQTAWADDFSQKITWMATQRNQSAELHLNPPQLGPLDVVLKMNGDQASATFTSPHAAVRDAIEQAIPKLREMLADSGIMLGNAMVSDQSAKNNQDNSSRKSQGRAAAFSAEGVTAVGAVQEARVSPVSRHNGMVDTFA